MDASRLGSLVDRHAPALTLYARQWCDEPEDVVQEAFVRLAAERTEPDDPAAWLFRAVRNRAINAGIARRRRLRREAEAASRSSWFSREPPATAVDPDAVQEALATLTPDQREVIVAHLWGALTFEQVAGLTGVSSSKAHRLYLAGLTTLRERLGVPCPTNRSRTRRI